MKLKVHLQTIILSIIFFSSSASAQLSKLERLEFIKNFEDLRSDLLVGDQEAIKSISPLIDQYEDYFKDRGAAMTALDKLQYAYSVNNADCEELKKFWFSPKFHDTIAVEHCKLMVNNSLLISMIRSDLLSNEYPYRLLPNKIIREIDFYELS